MHVFFFRSTQQRIDDNLARSSGQIQYCDTLKRAHLVEESALLSKVHPRARTPRCLMPRARKSSASSRLVSPRPRWERTSLWDSAYGFSFSESHCVAEKKSDSIKNGHHKQGTEVKVEVRNKLRDGKIVKMPFVGTKYYRG
jgi:hypothetical protein